MTRAERRAENRKNAERTTKRRAALILLLSPDLRCAGCKERFDDPSQLIVDHVDGKTWTASKLSSSQRIARYYRELAAGIQLRALCSKCSDTDGAYRSHGLTWVPPGVSPDEVPF